MACGWSLCELDLWHVGGAYVGCIYGMWVEPMWVGFMVYGWSLCGLDLQYVGGAYVGWIYGIWVEPIWIGFIVCGWRAYVGWIYSMWVEPMAYGWSLWYVGGAYGMWEEPMVCARGHGIWLGTEQCHLPIQLFLANTGKWKITSNQFNQKNNYFQLHELFLL